LNKKTFSFDVQNPKESTITCKLKRTALFGLVKLTKKKQKTKLVNIGNKAIQLLANFKVAVNKTEKKSEKISTSNRSIKYKKKRELNVFIGVIVL
jgi:3-deoxy-D-manno-octulosonic-acid transferase